MTCNLRHPVGLRRFVDIAVNQWSNMLNIMFWSHANVMNPTSHLNITNSNVTSISYVRRVDVTNSPQYHVWVLKMSRTQHVIWISRTQKSPQYHMWVLLMSRTHLNIMCVYMRPYNTVWRYSWYEFVKFVYSSDMISWNLCIYDSDIYTWDNITHCGGTQCVYIHWHVLCVSWLFVTCKQYLALLRKNDQER